MSSDVTDALTAMALELKARSTVLLATEVSLFVIIDILILLGNLLTFYVIWKNRNLWTITNVFVVSLAAADFCMALISLPFCVAANAKSKWPFGDALCQYQGYSCLVLAIASIQNLTWMAVNRFYRVVKPQHYRRYFNARSIKGIIVFIWVIAALSPAPYLLTGKKYFFIPAKLFCSQSIARDGYMAALLVTFHVGIPSAVIVYCYCKVFSTVRRHNTNVQQSTSRISIEEIKITRTLFAIVILFLLCWIPIFSIDVTDTIRSSWSFPRQVYVLYGILVMSSSLVNPICYGIMNPKFRKGYFNVLSKLTCYKISKTRIVVVLPIESDNCQSTVNPDRMQRVRNKPRLRLTSRSEVNKISCTTTVSTNE